MAPVAWHHQRTSGIHLLAVGLDSSLLTTLIIFAVLFTAMLCVEISIMLKQIKKGGE